MKPVTGSATAMMTASDPSKLGRESDDDGGATAPTQNAEHALQDECDILPSSVSGVPWPAWSAAAPVAAAMSLACPP